MNFFNQSSNSFKVLPAIMLLAAFTTCLATTSQTSFLFVLRYSKNLVFNSSSTCSLVIPSMDRPLRLNFNPFKSKSRSTCFICRAWFTMAIWMVPVCTNLSISTLKFPEPLTFLF
uniref:Uncharacterized protein n=1 Tax=Panstrongylus lignarius TaxID=156445 RepID=A0A224Y0M1_9HEMI